ncbi:MAG TPA: hypothetical protein QF564_12905 [Pirellulaceae bacterium]|nr:hypothetical protein [Pirellulaceae bacterium]
MAAQTRERASAEHESNPPDAKKGLHRIRGAHISRWGSACFSLRREDGRVNCQVRGVKRELDVSRAWFRCIRRGDRRPSVLVATVAIAKANTGRRFASALATAATRSRRDFFRRSDRFLATA